MLIPNNVGNVCDAIEEENWDEFGLDGDNLASCISLGDNLPIRRKHSRGGFLHLTMHQDCLPFLKTFHLSLGITIQH